MADLDVRSFAVVYTHPEPNKHDMEGVSRSLRGTAGHDPRRHPKVNVVGLAQESRGCEFQWAVVVQLRDGHEDTDRAYAEKLVNKLPKAREYSVSGFWWE